MRKKRTYQDRRESNIRNVIRRRKEIRVKSLMHLGGKCKRCGYDKCLEALEFHHRDPSEKEFNVSSKGHCRSWERVKKEIEKCDLLCANCHREIHADKDKLAALTRNGKMKSE